MNKFLIEKNRIRRKIPKQIINIVINRDDGKCILCGQPFNDIHHARYGSELHNLPRGIQARNTEKNLALLCRKCHQKIHMENNKRKAQQVRKYLLSKYPL